MRVMHLCERFITGGIESLVFDLCAAMVQSTQSSIVHLYGPTECQCTSPVRTPVIPVRMHRRLRIDPVGLYRLRHALLESEPDVLHCHGYYAALAALLLRPLGPSPPIVYTVHANFYSGRQRSDALIRHVARSCECVVAVSHRTGETVRAFTRGAVHPHVVMNGIDLSRLRLRPGFDRSAKRVEIGASADALVYLTVAGLNTQKDHTTLLMAFSDALQSLGASHLLIAGDGPERPRLEELVRGLDLQDRVSFLGQRTDVGELLGCSDVFVLSSHSEGLPIAVIEACCAGVPVIASRVGSLCDLEAAGIGLILTEPRDRAGLSQALQCAGRKEGRASGGQELAARAQALFGIESVARQYQQLYATVTALSRGRAA